jgi:predicted MPP superfamily phosphohydrolase
MILGLMSDIHSHRGDHADEVANLLESINNGPSPDLLLFLGDTSHRIPEIDQFLQAIKLRCPKGWIPGNHDIWVIDKESQEDTADHRYTVTFPHISKQAGWHYLPNNPLCLSRFGIAIIGTIGWFSGDGYSEWFDADSSSLDQDLAKRFGIELEKSLEQVPQDLQLIVATHHLSHNNIPSFDPTQGNLWNIYLERFLEKYKDRIVLVVHGHRHVRYDPANVDDLVFVAHPFGYPHQHNSISDGYRTLEVPVNLTTSSS